MSPAWKVFHFFCAIMSFIISFTLPFMIVVWEMFVTSFYNNHANNKDITVCSIWGKNSTRWTIAIFILTLCGYLPGVIAALIYAFVAEHVSWIPQ
ncbi:hypothetical protein C9374_004150 [Naegleria lovaniensis]|uniref:Uncharacterized protein n=1 Tax=Naegleria lovaniensis TaxID=51637 RepID=A0AA88KJ23_NAELO|nr:uncharacterized protein C9374_004150 [Naegleria lovaniensis]KAG2383479.1 hypothetical protein C9374_004150 [Naegleria lovaniensis]